jgi:hypothetical protein
MSKNSELTVSAYASAPQGQLAAKNASGRFSSRENGPNLCSEKILRGIAPESLSRRSVPHALEMHLELSGGSCIMEYDQIVILPSHAAGTEIRRSCSEQLIINLVGSLGHQRPKPFEPNVVGEVAELGEVVMLARIEHDADSHAAAIRGV